MPWPCWWNASQVTLELGGKSPVIICSALSLTPKRLTRGPQPLGGGINIEEACKRHLAAPRRAWELLESCLRVLFWGIIVGKFINSGQTCIAPDYVLVERHVQGEVVRKLKEATLEMLGEGAEAAQKMTRLINPEAKSWKTGEAFK